MVSLFIFSPMLLYFEFEGRRVVADVEWPKGDDPIVVHLTDAKMVKEFPTDLNFEIKGSRKVSYILEDKDNKRLTELQDVIGRRLQEFVTKS